MKKIISVMSVALLMLCMSVTVFALPYEEATVISSVEFEGLTDADLGGESQIIGDFDDHSTWSMTEGFATIAEGNNGNGLMFTPDYDNENGFQASVMRSDMNILAQDKDAWKNAWGWRVWINNTSEYDVTVCPILFTEHTDGDWVLGLNTGTFLLNENGEYEDILMDAGVNGCGVIIPYEFKGWLIVPNTVGEVDSDAGWQEFPGWSTSSETLVLEEVDFGMIRKFALDIRFNGLLAGDEGGLIIDSVELFGTAGEDIEMPDPEDAKPTQSPTATGAITETPSATATDDATTPSPANDLTLLYIGIAVVAVCVIVAVVIVVSKKKKAANAAKDNATEDNTKDE